MSSALGAVLLASGLGACFAGEDATPAAQALADALASGSFDDVPLAAVAPADVADAVAEMVGGMGESGRTVRLSDIDRTDDDDVRTATFEVTWDLPHIDDDWSYTTTALLSFTGGVWLVDWSPEALHPKLTDGAIMRLRTAQPERASVLGAAGVPIVTARPVYRVGVDKTDLDPADAVRSAEQLAGLLDIDVDSYAGRVEASGDRAFVEAIMLREEDADGLTALDEILGARAISTSRPLAPTRSFARPVLGSVGEATNEIIEESGGQISAGDLVGLSGLQREYDKQLRGQPAITVEVIGADGTPDVVFEREAVDGEAVVTTLDVDLQFRAERVLADVEPASALVAIEPSTGYVLAAASGPGGGGYSTATVGQYAPGSTFKIVTALAMLRAGTAPDAVLDCPETTVVDGKRFKNYSDYPGAAQGQITFTDVIAHSCNTALIDQRDTISQADLADAAATLGLGLHYRSGVPAYGGSVPDQAGDTEHAASMIGQGRVLASPLAMATVAASVAAGRTVTPTIVRDGGPPDTDTTPLTGTEADHLRTMMRAAVRYGSATFLGDVPGEPIGAKTGTAEYGEDAPPRTHAWMIAIRDDLAVAVFVEDGESGSRTAGPLLEQFLVGG